MESTTLTARMPAELAQSLRAAARIHGRSTSEELRLALTAWLDVTRRELLSDRPELTRAHDGERPADPRSGAAAVSREEAHGG